MKKINLFLLFFTIFVCHSYAQKSRNKLSIGTSSDFMIGPDYNTYAQTINFNYKISPTFRVSPSFSYFFKKNDVIMKSFQIDFHYLFANKNKDIFLYPIAGIYLLFVTDYPSCKSCSVDANLNDRLTSTHYGFDFGVGGEYRFSNLFAFIKPRHIPNKFLRTYDKVEASKIFNNFSLKAELVYPLIVKEYARPIFRIGLLYNL